MPFGVRYITAACWMILSLFIKNIYMLLFSTEWMLSVFPAVGKGTEWSDDEALDRILWEICVILQYYIMVWEKQKRYPTQDMILPLSTLLAV